MLDTLSVPSRWLKGSREASGITTTRLSFRSGIPSLFLSSASLALRLSSARWASSRNFCAEICSCRCRSYVHSGEVICLFSLWGFVPVHTLCLTYLLALSQATLLAQKLPFCCLVRSLCFILGLLASHTQTQIGILGPQKRACPCTQNSGQDPEIVCQHKRITDDDKRSRHGLLSQLARHLIQSE